MKNRHAILLGTCFFFMSCSQHLNKTTAADTPGSGTENTSGTVQNKLTARLEIAPVVKQGDSILLKFTVYNNTDQEQKFCKWHTPFEPLMSKYLDITDANGTEASYKGPMAKRVMPPPASSYITLKPKDSISVSVNLLQAYDIASPSKYTIHYNATGISGVTVTEDTSFLITE